ncbi:transcriptional regulator [Vibrio breoganii]|uniref:TetR/AcrR family transcriptional regulator n=1 Tax=Vibrio breoganii TaxID=553239 RepID=UPI000C821CF2|nr:TetR/AcrR family transcriptional regulator [Vibrio breoganii]PML87631.1 transcriptional regulator [Vibrio breoganii]PMO97238.1 transcriptional regulator [Vibrio breoganii]
MSVNQKKRGRPKGSGNQLSSDAILRMAKSLMKAEGKIPSIRKLASNLNVDAMAIYYYFENKNKLLEAITSSLVNDIYEPVISDDWKSELYKLCTSYLSLHEDYPGLLETMLSMDVRGPAEVFYEKFEQVTKPLALDEATTMNGVSLLADYLHGYVLAMSCNSDREALDISMVKGPLQVYCMALENSN